MIKKVLTIFLAIIIGSAPCANIYSRSFDQDPAQMGMPQIDVSPDQLQKMETMMEEMQKFYNNLSDAEKNQFETELATEVAKEEQKIKSMDPEQQKNYIETAFRQFDEIDLDALLREIEEEEEMRRVDTTDQEEKTTETIKKKQEQEDREKAEQEKKEKIKKILDTIDKIIKLIDSFTGKLNAILPGAQELIDKWISKGYIARWAGRQSTYTNFRNDLDQMRQKLEKLKGTDPKTGKYKYLDNVKDAEKLGGQLEMLLKTIQRYEPNIEITQSTIEYGQETRDEEPQPEEIQVGQETRDEEPEEVQATQETRDEEPEEVQAAQEIRGGKLKNEAAKSALKRLISYLVDTIKTISAEIDTLIEKFEGEAGKIRKEEEKLAKKAQQEQRRMKRYGRGKTRTAGRPQEPDYGYTPFDDDYSPDYGYGDSGAYTPTDYADYGDYPDTSAPSGSGSGGTSSEQAGKKDPVPSGKKTPEKPKEKPGTEKVYTPVDRKAAQYKKLQEQAPRSAKALDTIEENLERFKNIWVENKKKKTGLKYNSNWQNLQQFLQSPDDLEIAREFLENTGEATSYLNRAYSEAKPLKRDIKKLKNKKDFKGPIQELHKKYEKTAKAINSKLNSIRKAIDEEEVQIHESKKQIWEGIKQLRLLGDTLNELKDAIK